MSNKFKYQVVIIGDVGILVNDISELKNLLTPETLKLATITDTIPVNTVIYPVSTLRSLKRLNSASWPKFMAKPDKKQRKKR